MAAARVSEPTLYFPFCTRSQYLTLDWEAFWRVRCPQGLVDHRLLLHPFLVWTGRITDNFPGILNSEILLSRCIQLNMENCLNCVQVNRAVICSNDRFSCVNSFLPTPSLLGRREGKGKNDPGKQYRGRKGTEYLGGKQQVLHVSHLRPQWTQKPCPAKTMFYFEEIKMFLMREAWK